jgi:hypothetical protein
MSTWTPPPHWTETGSQLRKTGSVVLDGNGNGVLNFDPDHANQRWVVAQVVVSTNQSATSTVIPVATLALNAVTLATLSPGNRRGASWSGNQDTFTGNMDVGPCDFVTVIFGPPSGTAGASLAGVTATAILTGTKYSRRG